jgi:hypothetical protein
MTEAEEGWGETNRWNLAAAFLKRSDESGTVLRSLLLGFAAAGIGFIASRAESSDHLLALDALAVLLLSLAAAIIIHSWRVQKWKAGRRFLDLRNHGYKHYREAEIRGDYLPANESIDKWAYGFIAAGLVFEFISLYGQPLCRAIS